jgi:23S rRNA pseudouridine1911/1915/1917 synthase
MTNPEKSLRDYNPNAPRHIELVIPPDCAGLRLDQALQRLLPEFSRNRLQAWMREMQVWQDGAPAVGKRKVWGGEKIRVATAPSPAVLAHLAEDIPLKIVHEDETLLVLNKPPGLVVHPGSGNWQGTLLNALLKHAPVLAGVPRAGIVHRLDKDTSGLLVVAKTIEAQVNLVRQLQARTVRREYLALVQGQIPHNGQVEAPIGRHPVARTKMAVTARGKPALTYYEVIERFADCTLLRCRLETGRTHQIRVHMQSIGHPLVGDPVYSSKKKTTAFARQALHACKLGLLHPQSGKTVNWETELPPDMHLLLESLRNKSKSEN